MSVVSLRPPLKRRTYRLTPHEAAELAVLSPKRGHWPAANGVFQFWRSVAAARGLDPATMIGCPNDRQAFTALPLGHGVHWCWPMPLKCETRPDAYEVVFISGPQFRNA